jgi:hypothetical protein
MLAVRFCLPVPIYPPFFFYPLSLFYKHWPERNLVPGTTVSFLNYYCILVDEEITEVGIVSI